MTKSIWKLFPSSLQVLGTLLIIDLAAISAAAQPKTNQIDLTTTNDLNTQKIIPSLNSLETFSAQQQVTISPSFTVSGANPLQAERNEELGKITFSPNASHLPSAQQDFQPINISKLQGTIREILATRFEDLPHPIVEQVNRVSAPSRLKQLQQIAEVTSSLDKFQDALTSTIIFPEETTSLIPNPTIASALYAQREIETPTAAPEDSLSKENPETLSSNHDTKDKSNTTKPKKKLSLLGTAPELLFLFRGSPLAFGAPTTVVEDFGSNTQLTADWGGARFKLAEDGIFFDLYSTTLAQGVTSGGKNRNSAVTQSLDAYLTFDTGRLGMWPGGAFQTTFQSRFGNNINGDAGSLSPVNTAAEWPIAGADNVGLVTEYFLFQAFSTQVTFLIGKFNPTNYVDGNFFANSYRYQFQNFSLKNNLMLGSYAPVSTWGAAVVWQPNKWFQHISAVVDPNASAENFADDFFKDATLFQQFAFAYKIAERPGNLKLFWALNTKDGGLRKTSTEFVTRSGRRIINFRDNLGSRSSSFMFGANFAQYLFTIAREDNRDDSPRREYVPAPGLGVFGRLGVGPESENLISLFGSFGLSGVGLIPGREYDQFGLGWYYVGISSQLRDRINSSEVLTNVLTSDGASENGLEFYYNFAITPAIQLTADVQYIFNPEFAREDHALVLGGRLQVAF